MPTVPTYDGPKIQQQNLPNARLSTNASPDAFGAVIGRGLQQAATVASSIYASEKRDADLAASQSAKNKMAEMALSLEQAALQASGENALEIESSTLADFDKTVSDLRNGLVNDDQWRDFDDGAANLRLSMRSTIGRHVGNQREKLYLTQEDVALDNARKLAASDYVSEQRIGNALIEQSKVLSRRAERLGWSPDILDAAIAAEESKTHIDVISRMLSDENYGLAEKYFSANGDGIADPGLREKIGAAVKGMAREAQALAVADTVWSTMGPRTDISPVNLDAMRKEIDKRITDPKERKLALAELSDRAHQHDYASSERERANVASVWGAVDRGSTLADIRKMPEFKALPDRVKVAEEITRLREGKGESDDGKRFELYWRLNQADVLKGMSPNEIMGYYPALGKSYTESLMKKREELNDPAKEESAKVDDAVFSYWTTQAGITDKEDLGSLRYKVEQAVRARQAGGVKLSVAERETELKRALMLFQAREPGWLWTSVEEKPLYQIEDTSTIVVPKTWREKITADFDKNGIRYTDQDIVDAYIILRK